MIPLQRFHTLSKSEQAVNELRARVREANRLRAILEAREKKA